MLVLAAGACTKSADDGDTPGGQADAAQQVQATSGAGGCTPEKYNGGVPKLDLKNITVGFAQSEKEANPFRITETQSIKDEAAKRGIKLITTNAQSDLNKEIADIQGMIAQGAKALIISPLNSEGLDPALKAAQDAKVPVMTIDRLLTTKTACKDYLGWIGSDFVKQGERAADAMIKATGDQGDVAILLGASGVNVTVDRTKGFKDQLAAKGSKLKIVAEQTGDFTREKGQKVTEQLISANPNITAIYAENDEMALGAVAALKGAEQEAGRRQDHHDRRHQGRGAGHPRRLDRRRHRVEPALRSARLPGAGGLLQRQGRRGEDHHLRQGVHEGQRAGRTGQRVLTQTVRRPWRRHLHGRRARRGA